MSQLVKIGGPLPAKQIDAVARELNEICRSMTLDLSFRIGKIVIERLYGSVTAWMREGTRCASYRQLAARGDLLLSPSTLCRSVGVYVLSLRLGGHGTFHHLGTGHFQELLPLGPREQERLAQVAEADRWTVARLREEVSRRRPNNRRTARAPHRLSMRFARLVVKQTDLVARLRDMVIDVETAARLREVVDSLKQQVEEIEARLAACDAPPESGRSVSSDIVVVVQSQGNG